MTPSFSTPERSVPPFWLDKPYYSLNAYFRKAYGEKLYKIALDAGFTCPNRDGTSGAGGCLFCSAGGSGDFAVPFTPGMSLSDQLASGISLFGNKALGRRFVAYFQAYTNTYGPLPYLEEIYRAALAAPEVAGISIATRPDCLPPQVLTLLVSLKKEWPDKFIWMELGLQTIHEETARFIRRGYPLGCFTEAVRLLAAHDIPVIAHVILGLPGETREMALETIHYLNALPVAGVKLQLLHVLAGTDLAVIYQNGQYTPLTFDAYLDWLTACLEQLSPQIVVHRLTGDGPKELLLAPRFSLNKRHVLNALLKRLREQNTWQGRMYHDTGFTDSL